ncbi:Cys-tRNA(Pro)/Cys-tRNA(Cys) deacylase [Alkalispirillum mobile]|uniref:Cys-tRNA(Pro)/Cys-tRNA(Cys) deacylase n=2 Tax=Alkalispirillum mobile TaxID=85925 RepID=A0A498C6T1_9GAMM|nr:Cys-tRNA(Pro)/Cys-tRNA(Cys) deacylase [Alkalispirillum mobile]
MNELSLSSVPEPGIDMTPAIIQARKAGIYFRTHRYVHEPDAASYGLEAADKLGLDPARVFKTLVAVMDNRRLVMAMVPVARQLDLKALARVDGAKKATMAPPREVERATGYVLGGVSPLGQKRPLAAFLDESAMGYATVHVSGGRRGLEIELAPADLLLLTGGQSAPVSL